MRDKTLLLVLQQVYRMVLRDLLLNFVQATDNDWDDRLVSICDAVLLVSPGPPPGGNHAG